MFEWLTNSWSLLRVASYAIYRRLFGPADPPPKPLYDILILGLSGAGKSAILKVLLGEPLEDLAPTKGFIIKPIATLPDVAFNVKEISGAEMYRKYWAQYYQGSAGLVFVLDGTCPVDDAMAILREAASHPALARMPLLLLIHKADLADCVPNVDVPADLHAKRSFMVARTSIHDKEGLVQAFSEFSRFYVQ